MRLDEAVAAIGLPQVDGLLMAYAQTGEAYVTHQFRVEVESAEEAIPLWLAAFRNDISGQTGTLYWRVRPEMERRVKKKDMAYIFYARFLISDKPVLPKYYDDLLDQKAVA